MFVWNIRATSTLTIDCSLPALTTAFLLVVIEILDLSELKYRLQIALTLYRVSWWCCLLAEILLGLCIIHLAVTILAAARRLWVAGWLLRVGFVGVSHTSWLVQLLLATISALQIGHHASDTATDCLCVTLGVDSIPSRWPDLRLVAVQQIRIVVWEWVVVGSLVVQICLQNGSCIVLWRNVVIVIGWKRVVFSRMQFFCLQLHLLVWRLLVLNVLLVVDIKQLLFALF